MQRENLKENTMKKIKLFLDYAKARPDGIITNQYSNMVQLVHIDTSYLS